MQNYGYKICYKKQGKNKLKIYLITNAYDLANWHIRWYAKYTPADRKTKRPIEDVEWLIIPIKPISNISAYGEVARSKQRDAAPKYLNNFNR